MTTDIFSQFAFFCTRQDFDFSCDVMIPLGIILAFSGVLWIPFVLWHFIRRKGSDNKILRIFGIIFFSLLLIASFWLWLKFEPWGWEWWFNNGQ